MATNRQLNIDYLKEQNNYSRTIQTVLAGLSSAGAASSLLPIEKAIASRSLIKRLWDLLPAEQDSYQFNSVEEQTMLGRSLLPAAGFTQTVTLHLGWDVLAFSCQLEAAWQSWKEYNELNTETFNCCIYPADLSWYVVRAGANLYPMIFTGDTYHLKTKREGL